MDAVEELLERNRLWAQRVKESDPDLFSALARRQTPEFLWIGCADSRVSASQITDLPPGRMFVHRNVANIAVPSDLSCMTVLQFAISVLGIRHIIVCGHYGCGGVQAAMSDEDHGPIDDWLNNIRHVHRVHARVVEGASDPREAFDRLCELNVIEQVRNVAATTVVRNASAQGFEITVYGWIFDIKSGKLKKLCRHRPGAADPEIDPEAPSALQSLG